MPSQIDPETMESDEKNLSALISIKEKIQILQQKPIVKEIADDLIELMPFSRTGKKLIKLTQKYITYNYNESSSDVAAISSQDKANQTEDIQTLRLKARL